MCVGFFIFLYVWMGILFIYLFSFILSRNILVFNLSFFQECLYFSSLVIIVKKRL